MMCLGEAWKQAKKIIEGACYEVPSRISLVKGERNVRQGVTTARCNPLGRSHLIYTHCSIHDWIMNYGL